VHVACVEMEAQDHADPEQESDHRHPSCNRHEPEPLNNEQDHELPEQLLDELLQKQPC
jgi:hypothetical protein